MADTYLPNPIAWRNDTHYELDGDNWAPAPISVDATGAVFVITQPRPYSRAGLTMTAVGDAAGIPMEGASCVVVQIASDTPPNGFNMSFEGINDDGPFQVQAVRTSNGAAENSTGVLNALPAYAWRIDTRGIKALQLTVTAKAAGSAAVKIAIQRA